MESSPGPWISALRHSHDRLRADVEPLGRARGDGCGNPVHPPGCAR